MKDDIVAYGGGELKNRRCSPAIEHFMRDWAMRNNLGTNYIKTQPKRVTVVYKYGKELEHGLVTLCCRFFYWSRVASEYTHQTLSDLYLQLQATTPNLDNTQPGKHPATFDAARVIIDFFQAHPLYTPLNVIVQRSPFEASGLSSVGSSVPSSMPASSFPGLIVSCGHQHCLSNFKTLVDFKCCHSISCECSGSLRDWRSAPFLCHIAIAVGRSPSQEGRSCS